VAVLQIFNVLMALSVNPYVLNNEAVLSWCNKDTAIKEDQNCGVDMNLRLWKWCFATPSEEWRCGLIPQRPTVGSPPKVWTRDQKWKK